MLNFEPWHQLLQQYVGDRGQVNYRAWQAAQPHALVEWLQQVRRLEPPAQPQEGLALWINLYNALTIAQILERYPINSIRPSVLGVPNWIAFLRFFTRPVCAMGSETEERHYSLNQIEHGILRAEFMEPRIHFALVCASVGCPHLRAEAYWPDRVEAQLEGDAMRFINNPEKVRYDERAGRLYCSQIFKWYGQDFRQVAPSVVAYINRYLKREAALPTDIPIRWLPYDWSLNQSQH